MQMTIDTSKLRVSTKAILSALTTLAVLMQIPQVNAIATAFLSAHPRLSPVVAAVGAAWTLLHNPEVQGALGIKKTVEVKETSEEVSLPAAGAP